jgi:DUF4097 and DUF4098 domain-containing protein YvlB
MHKILYTVLLGIGALSVKAQSSSGHTPPFLLKNLADANLKEVSVQTSGGNISVMGVAPAEARVEVYIYSDGRNRDDLSKAEIQKKLDADYDFSITVLNNKLTAIAKPKEGHNNWRSGLSITFKVYAPMGISSTLKSSGGNIQLKNLSGGSQEFKTSGGNLDIDMVSGKIRGKTSGGNISLTDSKDDIDVRTSGGNVDAANCQGNIQLHTSGGNMSMKVMQGVIMTSTSGGNVDGEALSGEFQTQTSGGNIHLEDLSCSLSASSSGGDITVTMKSVNKYVTLTNSSGNINLQIPQGVGMDLQLSGDKVKTSKLSNFQGDVDETHVNGTINGGGVPVKVHGSSGRVSVTLR